MSEFEEILKSHGQLPEPAFRHKKAAHEAGCIFAAYLDQGFTRVEALDLIKTMITAG